MQKAHRLRRVFRAMFGVRRKRKGLGAGDATPPDDSTKAEVLPSHDASLPPSPRRNKVFKLARIKHTPGQCADVFREEAGKDASQVGAEVATGKDSGDRDPS